MEKLISKILRSCKRIVVVGLSRSPARDSHMVASYLKDQGYKIIPVNPQAKEILGEHAYPTLDEIPVAIQRTVDAVDIFRPSNEIAQIFDQAMAMHERVGRPLFLWTQLGIVDFHAAEKARQKGIDVVMDRCMMVEHSEMKSAGKI